MEKGQLNKLLSLIGVTSTGWIRLPDLNYIVLESDANQYFNPMTQKIKFDTANDLIKIKYSVLKPISCPVQQFSYNKTHKTIFINTGLGSVYSYKNMREPEVGDYFAAFCPGVDTSLLSSPITHIEKDMNRTQITLADDKIFTKIEITKKPMIFVIVLKGVDHFYSFDKEYELFEEPTTDDSFADIYIDISKVIGFEFDKSWRPN